MSFWQRIADIDEALDRTSYYELLGVASSAVGDDISERYYQLAAKLHPDRFVARAKPEQLAALNRIHARLGEAKKVLLHPRQRAQYDQELAAGHKRQQDTSEPTRRPAKQDPATPMARKLYESALQDMKLGNEAKAKANLQLAKHYEPASDAIAKALARLEGDKSAETVTAEKPPEEHGTAPESAGQASAGGETPAEEAARATTGPPATAPAATTQRAHERHTAVLPVRLRIPTWERFDVLYSRDISRGGMFLKSSKGLPKGSKLRLQLLTPQGETIEIDAVVAHHREAGSGRPAGMGLQFEELSDETRQQLDQIMEKRTASETLSLETLVSELVRIRDLPPHQVLDIPMSAGRDESRLAYEKLVRRYHPHRNGADKDPAMFDICRELISCIRSAYERLGS